MAEKKETKRYATRFGMHYSIVMKPSVTQVINGIPVTTPGKTIEFKNGIYETDDKDEQKFLEASEQYGRDFKEVTGEVNSALQARSLEEKEQELKEREADIEKREMELKGQGHEEGADTPKTDVADTKKNDTADQKKDDTTQKTTGNDQKKPDEKKKDEATF